ncbi:Oligoxyloglucan reducing end-specific cellobiohydrolase [Mycena galopus ATCC 62051]|nr:Oligoxyloglucan reducing end-specific cellobiohydrolase [Mycena galopus ATCC 62051]
MHRYLRTFLCLSISLALGQNPEHTVTGLGRDLKTNLFFFPNSTSALRFSHEERSLYVSHDAGRSWKRPNSMPGSLVQDVILHPFNDRMAFVMTNPRDPTIAQTHYRTEDSGQNWIPFELPPSPAHQISLSFHADPNKSGHILYLCQVCDTPDRDRICHRETYITTDAFNSPPHRMLNNTVKCQFAHNSNEFKPDVDSDLVYCIQSVDGGRLDSSTARLYSSTDYFDTEKKVEESCAGKGAKGFITANALPFDVFASTPNFAVLALEVAGEMVLCVSRGLKTWTKAEIPVRFRRNQYFLLPAGRGLGIDVYTSPGDRIGTVFVSDESGTRFVESLRDTNGIKELGEVDSEAVAGLPGVALINVVANAAEVVGRGAEKQLQTLITYDGARSWAPIASGADLCAADTCALHLYPRSVSTLYSKTSSGSPGVIVSVGSAGPAHLPFKDSDTFISTDAGRAWAKLADGAFIYEFGDAGSILVMINSESPVNELQYSVDLGVSWQFYNFGVNVTPLDLIPVPEAGSWKFVLYAERSPVVWADRYVYIYLDFANMRKSQCTEDDFETWHATSPGSDTCLMGSKQPFKRRKPHLDCYVGDTVTGQLASEGSCPCSDADYECDQNFAWDGHACVPVAPEAIPPGMCTSADDVYMGSSGYRKVPGNTCTGGSKDAQVQKSCQPVQPEDGAIHHQTFEFPSRIVQHQCFENSTTILVLLLDHTLWQSSNEGYSWTQLYPEEHFTQFYLHKYAPSRAYLLTKTDKFYLTVDGGRTWSTLRAPTPPTAFHIVALRFHPEPDMLLWLGDRDCKDFRACRVEAQYSLNNGRTWSFVEEYVVNCAWAEGTKLAADPREILCESFSNKTGSQMLFQMERNPLSLVEGPEYFTTKKTIFERVVGFAKFSEFLVVAEMLAETLSLRLQISLDGVHFAAGQFPPNMRPDGHAYTILDSSTASLFVHMTMTEPSSPNSQTYWGNILKSNSNGTYFSLSAENVNRDGRGYVDFEKMVGLDGIALINVVSNPEEALLTGHKVLQSKITHNDGSTWKPLDPPTHDSLGNLYPCHTTRCALHVHGYTERLDSSTTFSSSSVVGLIMAVGNVGESLVPYDQSDTFLSRDGGFTWEEVHKDAHLWKIGDSGSIIVIANDEEPTDHVLFSTNEGMTWRHYKFSDDPVRVRSIMTVPADTSRRFLLLGHPTRSSAHLAIFLDFTALTSRQCVIDVQDPGHDDFELWSPSDERAERCLFGRTTLYHRRVRETDCYVGIQPKANERVVRACTCVKSDFECEFNYYKNAEDECVLVPGTSSLPNEEICEDDAEYWYERTAYRKIAFSSCEDGERLDQGPSHPCLRYRNYHSGFSWLFVFIPLSLAAVGGYWYCRHARIPPSRILEHMRGMLDRIWSRRERLGYQAVPLND